MENLNLLATVFTGIGLYFSLKTEVKKDIDLLRQDLSKMDKRQDGFERRQTDVNSRLDATWAELLAITRQFKTTQETK